MTSPRLDCLVASSRTGAVLRELNDDAGPVVMHELAAILPEVLGSVESASLARVALLLDPNAESGGFSEVLLLSESHVHVIHPLPEGEGEVLVACAPAGRSVGLVLSQVHARAAGLGSEP